MSDNQCKNCGQWSGKGHSCPTPASPSPNIDLSVWEEQFSHTTVGQEMDERIERARQHLVALEAEKAAALARFATATESTGHDHLWSQRRDHALRFVTTDPDLSDEDRVDITTAASDDLNDRRKLAAATRELHPFAQGLLATDPNSATRIAFAEHCVNPTTETIDSLTNDDDPRVQHAYRTRGQADDQRQEWINNRDHLLVRVLDQPSPEDHETRERRYKALLSNQPQARFNAILSLDVDDEVPDEIIEFLSKDDRYPVRIAITEWHQRAARHWQATGRASA